MKKLERSRESRVIAGVCGGLAEYFHIDPVIFRIAFVVLGLLDGIGVVAYIICWIAIPDRKPGEVAQIPAEPIEKSEFWRYLPGLGLILIGVLFLIRNHYFWFDFHDLWPVVLIVLGGLLVFMSLNKKRQEQVDERG